MCRRRARAGRFAGPVFSPRRARLAPRPADLGASDREWQAGPGKARGPGSGGASRVHSRKRICPNLGGGHSRKRIRPNLGGPTAGKEFRDRTRSARGSAFAPLAVGMLSRAVTRAAAQRAPLGARAMSGVTQVRAASCPPLNPPSLHRGHGGLPGGCRELTRSCAQLWIPGRSHALCR